MQKKLIGIAAIAFGALNCLPVLWETKWYLTLCFLLLGLPPIAAGFMALAKKNENFVRPLSWTNLIFGLSILSLAMSSFYGSVRSPAFQFAAAIGLTLAGLFGLYVTTKKLKLEIIP